MSATRTVDLSTGHAVTLPLSTDADVVGATFGADYHGVDALVPESLAPVSVTPGRAAVTVMCVEYRRIDDGTIDPYREVGVLFPVVADDGRVWPRSALSGTLGGYVWTLPVTTEPARALGEVWSYPKRVADITFSDDGRWRETTLDADGERVLSLGVKRPRTVSAGLSTRSYTSDEAGVVREPITLQGAFGGVPLSGRVTLSLGQHRLARTLRSLDIGSRALARFGFDGEFRIAPPERVGTP